MYFSFGCKHIENMKWYRSTLKGEQEFWRRGITVTKPYRQTSLALLLSRLLSPLLITCTIFKWKLDDIVFFDLFVSMLAWRYGTADASGNVKGLKKHSSDAKSELSVKTNICWKRLNETLGSGNTPPPLNMARDPWPCALTSPGSYRGERLMECRESRKM